jgi:hypothetical protein
MPASDRAVVEVEDDEEVLEEVLMRAIGSCSSVPFSIADVGDAGKRSGLASTSALWMNRSVGSIVTVDAL